jgi:predicted nucleic-acid-binding Zn-ribbon protein
MKRKARTNTPCVKCGCTATRRPSYCQSTTRDKKSHRQITREFLSWPCLRCGHVIETDTLDGAAPQEAQRLLSERYTGKRKAEVPSDTV